MTHASTCPQCCSRYEDIRGLLYSPGQSVGVQCADDWHKGRGYDASILHLTDGDRVFLKSQKIKV
jgi:hypothetical protein